MPRFKPVHKGLKLLPVDFERQLVPGTFEHALSYLIDHEFNFQRQAEKMESAARKMLDQHRAADAAPQGEARSERVEAVLHGPQH